MFPSFQCPYCALCHYERVVDRLNPDEPDDAEAHDLLEAFEDRARAAWMDRVAHVECTTQEGQ